jgi:hypothetical protein
MVRPRSDESESREKREALDVVHSWALRRFSSIVYGVTGTEAWLGFRAGEASLCAGLAGDFGEEFPQNPVVLTLDFVWSSGKNASGGSKHTHGRGDLSDLSGVATLRTSMRGVLRPCAGVRYSTNRRKGQSANQLTTDVFVFPVAG